EALGALGDVRPAQGGRDVLALAGVLGGNALVGTEGGALQAHGGGSLGLAGRLALALRGRCAAGRDPRRERPAGRVAAERPAGRTRRAGGVAIGSRAGVGPLPERRRPADRCRRAGPSEGPTSSGSASPRPGAQLDPDEAADPDGGGLVD